MEKIKSLVSENGVVIFTKSTCCLCYAVTILFQELRVNPVVYEIDEDPEGREIEKALLKQGCKSPIVLAVYIGGKLKGSTNEVMSLHLSGSLLKQGHVPPPKRLPHCQVEIIIPNGYFKVN